MFVYVGAVAAIWIAASVLFVLWIGTGLRPPKGSQRDGTEGAGHVSRGVS